MREFFTPNVPTRFTAVLFVCVSILAQDRSAVVKYPLAPKSTQTDDYHGVTIADPYRGLEDADAPSTRKWVDEENKITRSYLDQVPGREEIQKRITSLWDFEKFDALRHRASRYFYRHNTGLQNQSVVYSVDSLDGTPRELIDPNTYRKDGTAALSEIEYSWDGSMAAYGVAQAGSDWLEFRTRDVATGKDHPDLIQWSKGGLSWAPDNKGFYYSRFPEPPPGQLLTAGALNERVFFHKLGDPQAADTLIWERPDHPNWTATPIVLEGGNYLMIFIYTGHPGANLLSYRNLRSPQARNIDLVTKAESIFDPVAAIGDTLYVRTTDAAPKGRVLSIDLTHPDRANWKEVVPQQPETLEDVLIAHGTMVLPYMKDAHSIARVVTLDGKPAKEVTMPGVGTANWFNPLLSDTEVFFRYDSFTTPPGIYRLNLDNGEVRPWRQPKVAFDPTVYETSQVFFPSKDGTRVPMFVSHRKGITLDGQNPTLLYGYGGFNIPITPQFNGPLAEWFDMGGIYASVNLRGGSEYGEEWHKAGMLAKKQNVFDDFISAAEYLIANHYTSTPKLAISGGSNGGLLVGAVLNQRPDLFGAAIPAVGVMDMLRFQKFGFGVQWVGEYGSPDNPEDFKILRAYSPLHNIHAGTKYPPTLIMTADHDDRVMPGHSLKYAATLQEAQGGSAPILIRVETRAGHGAGKPTSKLIEQWADEFAFLKSALHIQ